MSTVQAKEVFVTWDGEPTTWSDYCRKVRLQYEKTPVSKRRLLGPELASRLTARAWTVTAELDHKQLSSKSGVKYLLEFLRSRLCQTAVPDAGARLEELLMKIRRPPGMGFAQWSAMLLESYRKLQRSLMRARSSAKKKVEPEKKSERRTASEPQSEPASPESSPGGRSRRHSAPGTPAHGQGQLSGEPEAGDQGQGGPDGDYEAVPQEDPDDRDWSDWEPWHGRWTAAQWREWLKEEKDEDDDSEDGLPWDELEQEELEVLPDEILGWLLLRRANLSSASRLSVQAAVQNSLKFRDIEQALRDQEEELLQGDYHRQQHPKQRRTFWVEEEGQWGLLAVADDLQEEIGAEVHWIGGTLPAEVYKPEKNLEMEDDEVYWVWENDGYHGYVQDPYGQWLETDGCGTYWTSEPDDFEGLTTEQAKELEEAYSAYETKARTFQQSRQFQRAKGQSRGFYPVQKGKKGKGKGKGFYRPQGKGAPTSTSSSTLSPKASVMRSEEVMSVSGKGCFICGDTSHGFRQCPKRTSQASPQAFHRGKGGANYMVENLNPSSLVFMAMPLQVQINTAGFGVLDLGATETVGSLEAVEKVLELRELHPGEPDEVRLVTGANKMFRFGNGEVKMSESYLLLPQQVGSVKVLLGIYTLMAEKVPILIGMKTLTKLGAIIDVTGGWLVLSQVDANVKIPLQKSAAGHLLVDLTQDWMAQGQPLTLNRDAINEVYMVQPLASDTVDEEVNSRSRGLRMSVMSVETLQNMLCSGVEPVMMNHVMSDEDDPLLQLCDSATVLLLDPTDQLMNVTTTPQDLRDQVMSSLTTGEAHRTRSRSRPHGAQDGNDRAEDEGPGEEESYQATSDRALRLREDSRSRPTGSSDNRESLLRLSPDRGTWSGQSQRIEQVCSVGELQGMSLEGELHPSLRSDRSHEEGRSSGCRHQEASGINSSQRTATQPEPEEREDQHRRSRDVITSSIGVSASKEEGTGEQGEGLSSNRSHSQYRKSVNAKHSDSRDSKGSEGRGKCRDSRDHSGASRGRRGDMVTSSLRHTDMRATKFEEKEEISPNYVSPTSLPSSTRPAEEGLLPEDWDLELYEATEEPGTLPGDSRRDRKVLSEERCDFLHTLVEDWEAECNMLMDDLKLTRDQQTFSVMELCCEADSGIGEAVLRAGGKIIRCGLHNGCDLSKESGVQKTLQQLREHKPDLLWVSFPCGPTSSIQELNMLTEDGRERIRKKVVKSKKLVANGIRVMEAQLQESGEIIQEWPLNNRAWSFHTIQNFWNRVYNQQNVFEARVDGCAYGLQVPEGLIKKPWLLRSTTSDVWNLQKKCSGDHQHVPCEGGQRTRLSALYPKEMCKRVTRVAKAVHERRYQEQVYQIYSNMAYNLAATPLEGNPDSLKDCTDEELQRWSTALLKLHKKLGHPSRQAFTRMLRDRGATVRMLTLASNLHCMDCEESKMANPAFRGITIESAENLWDVVQLDNFEFTYGEEIYHWQLMVDEASGYAVVNFLKKHSVHEGYSPSTAEVLEGILHSWVQYFGYPKKMRMDREGGHRGRDLAAWGDTHGVELEFVPAEAHGQIGKVESAIGKLKTRLLAHLRGDGDDPRLAAYAMVAAHNSMSRKGGYSPIQWVFGRDFTDTDRLHDGPDLPFISSLATDEKFRYQAELRDKARKKYKELQDLERLSKAMNMKATSPKAFHPGDLVYYKRHQAPAEGRSHKMLDVPRRQIARWYGPARILGCETKVTYDGQVRQPHRLAWIVSQGRLKRVHTDQLRHASEREKLVNEEYHDVLATPWTFSDVTSILGKGSYDDIVEIPHLRRGRAHDVRPKRSPSRGRAGQLKRGGSPARSSSQPPTRPRTEEAVMEEPPESDGYSPSPLPDRALPAVPDDRDLESAEELDIEKLLDEPYYMPQMEQGTGPLFEHAPFQRARERHEAREYQAMREMIGPQIEESMWVCEEPFEESLIYAVTLPTPATQQEWKKIVKDPSKFVAKQLAKGVEVSWHKLNPEQRRAMAEAKQVEIKEWVTSKVCKAALGDVDPARVMKMRWVLVFKGTDDPNTVKAKARLVVLGFSDPDVGLLNTKSPTMSRRSRQLLLQFSTLKGLPLLKADAKAAFLQGLATQGKRSIFGRPVEELRVAMGLEPGQMIQFMKAAYGLTIAPREFYLMVDQTLESLGFRRLITDPCLWEYVVEEGDKPHVLGIIGSHVDDFLMVGHEDDDRWVQKLEEFHASMRWSPWEHPPLTHCGVRLQQMPDSSWRMDQTDYCNEINQIQPESKQKDLTPGELHQARAVLGAIQWRTYQTGFQHAAKLGYFQSMVTKGDRSMVEGINKMVREVHSQKDIGLHIHQLCTQSEDDLVLVGWSDAALANRPDLSSTGGYVIGFVHKDTLDFNRSGPGRVNVMSWGSHKLKRVCRSSLAAEVQALAETEQELMYLRVQWREMLGYPVDLNQADKSAAKVKGVLVVDAKALYDAATGGEIQSAGLNMKEKYTALELMGIMQHIKEQRTELRWCNSDQQLADGMTKASAQDRLRKFLLGGQLWSLQYDENFTSAKKKRKLDNEQAAAADETEGLSDLSWIEFLQRSHVSATTLGACKNLR